MRIPDSERSGAEPTVLATVLFVDIVHSTERLARVGDRRWKELLERFHALVRDELDRFGGDELDTAGDGVFARFGRPAEAVRCACAITDAVGELRLQVRAGVHLGECELVDGKLGGLAVHVGARLAGDAEPGEVLVSSAVREALAGSRLRFVDAGLRRLPGLESEWHVFTVDKPPLRREGRAPVRTELLGREPELARIDELLAAARAGRSRVLVVTGEAGIGKTALLRYAAESARDMIVLRAGGIEAESALAFAGLGDLVRPVAHRIDALPGPQADALRAALALGPPAGSDRFAVCAATLSLLAAVAEERPVLGVVDDVQWLDRSSAEALLFAARRLESEGVALVFARRTGEESAFAAVGLEELEVAGLDPESARALLARATPDGIAGDLADRLVRETAGNPLALVELPRLLTPAQVAGEEPVEGRLPVGPSVERAFARRLERLPGETRDALTVAAAADSSDLDVLAAALDALGLGLDALDAAEAAGLVSLQTVLEFPHPLARSAAYQAASPAQRRAAHAALAGAVRGDAPAERRAWHLASAVPARDDAVAALLEHAAGDVSRRGGHAEAASALERAAELTEGVPDRARRLLEAANAARLAGRVQKALGLLDEALAAAGDARTRARVQHLRGVVMMWHGAPLEAHALLVAEARGVEDVHPARAARMLTDASWACFMAGRIIDGLETAERACAVAGRVGGFAEALARAALGIALVLRGETERAVPLFEPYQQLVSDHAALDHPYQLIRPAGQLLTWFEQHDRARLLLERTVETARSRSAVAALPYLLAGLSELDYRVGHWATAYAGAAEAVEIAEHTQQGSTLAFALACLAQVEAAQGRTDDCLAHLRRAHALAATGIDAVAAYVHAARGLLFLGLGRPEDALPELERLADVARAFGLGDPNVIRWAPDLIESYVRLGRHDDARREVELFAQQAESTGHAWGRAVAERCRGLVAGDDDYEERLRRALELHGERPMPFDRARTELVLGERLRRSRRRSDAREPLRSALEAFERLGAAPWAERARAELQATGEQTRPRDPSAAEQLTPQEIQVALVVARGATNREAGAALFLSPKTIETHLGRVYRKLGVRSRTELAHRLATEGLTSAAGVAPPV